MRRKNFKRWLAASPDQSTRTAFFLYLITVTTYLVFGSVVGFQVSPYNYFSHIAYALLHGSVAFVTQPASTLDLVPFGGKLYLFAPPSPVLFVLPFVTLFGLNVSDSLYTAIIGAWNPVILYFVILQFAKLVRIPIPRHHALLFAIFYAFGTSHFYEAVTGTVWHTGQIFTQTFLLLALLCLFLYMEKKQQQYALGLAVLFVCAILGRNQLLLAVPGLLILIYLLDKEHWQRPASMLLVVGAISIIFNGLYNYARFGSIFENGFKYHNYNPFFANLIASHGLFSVAFIPMNIWYNFLNPLHIKWHWPFIFRGDYLGNSIFFVSPLFLCLFALPFVWQSAKKYKWTMVALLIASVGVYVPAALQFSTGWRQFGARYLLDSTPFIVLILIIITHRLPKPFLYTLVFLSIYLQLHAFLLFGSIAI